MKQSVSRSSVGVILTPEVPDFQHLQEGLLGLLRSNFLLKVRISLYPGTYSRAWNTAQQVGRLVPATHPLDLEAIEPGRNYFYTRQPPHVLLAAAAGPRCLQQLPHIMRELPASVPAVIALLPDSCLKPRDLLPFFPYSRCCWVPFGWFPDRSNRLTLLSRCDLWGTACRYALRRKQLRPPMLEHPAPCI